MPRFDIIPEESDVIECKRIGKSGVLCRVGDLDVFVNEVQLRDADEVKYNGSGFIATYPNLESFVVMKYYGGNRLLLDEGAQEFWESHFQ